MKIIDINILIYAVNKDAPLHNKAKKWLEDALSGIEPFGFSWVVILGFLRIITNAKIFPHPITLKKAISLMDEWLSQYPSQIILPTNNHWNVLKELLKTSHISGNITSDTHLAALVIEYDATLYSTDNDFNKFKNLQWINPLVS